MADQAEGRSKPESLCSKTRSSGGCLLVVVIFGVVWCMHGVIDDCDSVARAVLQVAV